MVYNAIGTRENIKIIDSAQYGGVKIDVMEYQRLLGSTNPFSASDLYFMAKQNIKVRQVAVYLTKDKVSVEPGAMSYFQGPLEMVSGVTAGNALGRLFSGAVTGEGTAQPEYSGSGMLVLEPSFQHFLLLQLDHEDIVVDKGMFYCAQGSVTVKPIMQRSVSAALGGGEGLFQISLSGTGLVVLECPVPSCEIDVIELNNDTLRVDGNFAVLRSGNLQFTVERSAKTLLGSAVSGEGLVNVYRGTGTVWLAPTIKVYNTINAARAVGGSTKSMNMNTSNSK
ncbi:AIM24 family protein [Pseudoflavonifractor sp. 524-17]|uniref:AIM24 family protein n=1 Tax=Pseudoflavonifractor sp. 524-17 TaxID=2304577 RepID=UPI00137AA1D6|nr:AIM24 family protein [Pseudoflavonifractor sp. 524-17]